MPVKKRADAPFCFGASPKEDLVKKLVGCSILFLLAIVLFGAVVERESLAAALVACGVATGFTFLAYVGLELIFR